MRISSMFSHLARVVWVIGACFECCSPSGRVPWLPDSFARLHTSPVGPYILSFSCSGVTLWCRFFARVLPMDWEDVAPWPLHSEVAVLFPTACRPSRLPLDVHDRCRCFQLWHERLSQNRV